MKKLKTLIAAAVCLYTVCALCAAPSYALEYNFSAPSGPEYGRATSIEPMVTADRDGMSNVDVSKNAALIPPVFGSAGAYTLNTGTPLTPNLAPGYMPGESAVSGGVSNSAGVGGNGGITVTPPDLSGIVSGEAAVYPSASTYTVGYTEVTSDLYYSGDYLAVLQIPSLSVSVKVYQGTDGATLYKGAGHFENTSIWAGNVAIAAHNRGDNFYFANIHTLNVGDTIILTTKLGTRTYAVTGVSKISEMDSSLLATTAENCVTLFTCVTDERAYRWAVRAVEI